MAKTRLLLLLPLIALFGCSLLWTSPLDPFDGDDLAANAELNEYRTDPFDTDTDDDGLSDSREVPRLDPTNPDTDGDGISDGRERSELESAPLSTDTDEDTLPDGDELAIGTNLLEVDSDEDGLRDGAEVHTYGSDPLGTDSDGDGLADGAEVRQHGTDPVNTDSDGDTFPDSEEVTQLGTSPSDADTDGDGIADHEEAHYGTEPTDPDADDDWLPDGAELEAGTKLHVRDTDGDGITDGQEVRLGLPPLADRVGDVDSDDDGLTDRREALIGTDPATPDTDADSIPDGDEVFEGGGTIAADLVAPDERQPDLTYSPAVEAAAGTRHFWLLQRNPYPDAHPLKADLYVHFLTPASEEPVTPETRTTLQAWWANRTVENPDGTTGVRFHSVEHQIPATWNHSGACTVAAEYKVFDETLYTHPYYIVYRKAHDPTSTIVGYAETGHTPVEANAGSGADTITHEILHSMLGYLDRVPQDELDSGGKKWGYHMTSGILAPISGNLSVPPSLETELAVEFHEPRSSRCRPLAPTHDDHLSRIQ